MHLSIHCIFPYAMILWNSSDLLNSYALWIWENLLLCVFTSLLNFICTFWAHSNSCLLSTSESKIWSSLTINVIQIPEFKLILFFGIKWFTVNTGTVLNASHRGLLNTKTSWNGKTQKDWQRLINIAKAIIAIFFAAIYTMWKMCQYSKLNSMENIIIAFIGLQQFAEL